MKQFRFLLALMMIPLMVLSAGGLNVFKHWCHVSGEQMISFQGPESCGHDDADHHMMCSSDCCHAEIQKEACCQNDHVYIRTVEDIGAGFDSPASFCKYMPASRPAEIAQSEDSPVLAEEYTSFDYSSPPRKSAKFIVVKLETLKLDC